MMNSIGSMKSEGSCATLQPSSPNDSSSVSETKRSCSIPSDLEPTNLLTPPSLSFPAVKFEHDGGDGEARSPDSSLWENFFSDQFESDFMILSPVRTTMPSPTMNPSYSHSYVQSVGQNFSAAASPPRTSSPLGPFNKGKGLSPLHRVFNSPNNQYMQIESLSLPPIDDFLDEYHKDSFGAYAAKMSGIGGSALPFDNVSAPPPPMSGGPSRFGSEHERDLYSQIGCVSGTPLAEQLKQEHRQEQLQLNINNNNSSNNPMLMVSPQSMGHDNEQDSGLQLVHLLLACAEAVAKEDYMLARRYLHLLNRVVTPLGDSMQRVAACFTEALSARLAATLTTTPSSSNPNKQFSPFSSSPSTNSLEILKIYQILYQACPYIKFAHFTANQAIFEAFESEERVHVIDLDILQGYQWPAFMQALAARPGGSPFLRITGVGPSIDAVRETGRCLAELAHSLHVPFEFHAVGEELEDLKPHMFNRRVGEALAVNSVNRLHRVPGHCLGSLLAMVRDQAPNIFTLVEKEASHNGPYFLGRFLEALHYYSAIFDSLDATFPAESAQRAKVEQYIFGPEIRNIVACEGAERAARHERLDKWRKMMEGKGFKGVPLSPNAVTQSKVLLDLYSCDGYRLTEDKGCLLLGWQDRALVAASAWRC